ncbi:alpha-amylase family glycosyl hydrolase [Fundicoccus culcitae]|uniref:Alpha-amylase family glycosyl hydrolase n=1 Tax=Fundicoccus culcitae TaxID=2969821 RepID=A0ABY5P2S9_9LACT|nr:alpha-amylase family glycosyl hydrolase [Fundicoccus culcitae]UUX33032.1 alpha-amylase family glycosyl hydrolase [Fundicoccus culcitae]
MKNKYLMKKSLVIALLMSPITQIQPLTIIQANDTTATENTLRLLEGTFEDTLQHGKQTLLTLEAIVPMKSMYADLSQLGGKDSVSISPELLQLTVNVAVDIPAGVYEVPIRATTEDGDTFTHVVEAEVVSPEVTDQTDWDEEIIYFMLTDRFYDGNPDNNNPYDLAYATADNPRGVYQGGDFKGITEKMDYLSDLGITTIWITPIVENIHYDTSFAGPEGSFYGYHGYWGLNFEALNPHLGTLAEFHEMIDTAADNDIKIMVDVVLNHTGYGLHPNDGDLSNPPAGYPTDQDRERFADMIRLDPGRNDLTMSLSGLPDFITEDPAVREQIVDWQQSWIERSTTPNGNQIARFRVDTIKHVDMPTLQYFKNQASIANPNIHMMGEAWGASHRSDGGYLGSGTMDGVLDFGFKTIANQFVNGLMEGAERDLEIRNQSIQSNATLGQFLSSHDEDGFLYSLEDDLGKYLVAVSLQLTAKGQLVIYYGEELGQSGANNWPVYDNRYDFDWENVDNNPILDHYQTLIQFRKDKAEILARGNRKMIAGSNDEQWVLVERNYNGESVYLAFNLADTPQTITIDVDSNDATLMDYYSGKAYTAEDRQISLELPAIAEGGTALLVIENGVIEN